MVKLIVGLGNPGREYEGTRHNVGFQCAKAVLDQAGQPAAKERFRSLAAEIYPAGRKVLVLCPQTFMNLSGNAVIEAIRYLQIADPAEELLVVYDDLDLPTGRIRLRQRGSSGGHNGLKSIIGQLGADAFLRIRIGIGRPPVGVAVIDHVLRRFSREEKPLVEDAVSRAAQAALEACARPFPEVMNEYNRV